MEGRIFSYIHFNGRVGTLVKISTITDFAARTAFGKDIAMHVAMSGASSVQDLLIEPSIKYDGASVQSLFDDITKKLGEKVGLIAYERFSVI